MAKKKMVLIGAGSISFANAIILDLLKDTGREWHLAMVDIDEEVLEASYKVGLKIVREQNGGVELSRSADRCDVLSGADYVVSTIGVGGRRAWANDVLIPRKYGIFQPIGDTTMAGGVSRAMRMIPAMVDITNDLMNYCPGAHYFNFSNPMSAVCRGIRKATGANVMGLCHGVQFCGELIINYAGLDKSECTTLYGGINHLTFIYDFRHKGKNAWPAVREKLRNLKNTGYDYSDLSKPFEFTEEFSDFHEPLCWSIFDDTGAFPAPGDTHVAEFYPERFPGGKIFGGVMGIDRLAAFEEAVKGGDAWLEQIRQWAVSDDKLPEEVYRSNDLFGITIKDNLVDIIDSIEGDKRRIFSINVPNNGAIPSLHKDAVLEVPTIVSANSLTPLAQPAFPDMLAGIVAKHLAVIEITVEAALKGDRQAFIEAVMAGGYISDRNRCAEMVDELIAVNRQYLPQFN